MREKKPNILILWDDGIGFCSNPGADLGLPPEDPTIATLESAADGGPQ